MGVLEGIVKSGSRIAITGPYGTEVLRRRQNAVRKDWHKGNFPLDDYLTADATALLTSQGRESLRAIASDYLASIPNGAPVIVTTPTFRLEHKILYAASGNGIVDSQLARSGFDLCHDAVEVTESAIQKHRKVDSLTIIAMSIGPTFHCYHGEETPDNVDLEYLPQTFTAARFLDNVNYVMFETVPSLKAAIGAAKAFTRAHDELSTRRDMSNIKHVETLAYLGSRLTHLIKDGKNRGSHPSYDPKNQEFTKIAPKKDYSVYFCVEADGTLNGIQLDKAVKQFYEYVAREMLILPVGLGLNCNNPELTHETLGKLSPESLAYFIGIHPNATPERNPRLYGTMTGRHTIPRRQFIEQVSRTVNEFGLTIFGGCCATNHYTLRDLIGFLNEKPVL